MTDYLLFKVSPERDLYMQWVMVADGPGRVANRLYWRAEIARKQEANHAGFNSTSGIHTGSAIGVVRPHWYD